MFPVGLVVSKTGFQVCLHGYQVGLRLVEEESSGNLRVKSIAENALLPPPERRVLF
jgi:hypothetical protein